MTRLLHNAITAAGLGAAVALVGWIDLATGPAISITLLYFLPVLFAAWQLGTAAGATTAVVASVVSIATDFILRAESSAALWNGGMRFGVLVVGVLLVRRAAQERRRTFEAMGRLDELLARESVLSRVDPLTGLSNRRGLVESLDRQLARARRHGVGLGVAYIDLDNFKRVNDLYGHPAGDTVLKDVSSCLRRASRAGDTLARIGGDELVCVSWDAKPESMRRFATRLCDAVRHLALAYPGTALGASAGVVCVEPEELGDADEVLRAADRQMYRVKRAVKAGNARQRTRQAATAAPEQSSELAGPRDAAATES